MNKYLWFLQKIFFGIILLILSSCTFEIEPPPDPLVDYAYEPILYWTYIEDTGTLTFKCRIGQTNINILEDVINDTITLNVNNDEEIYELTSSLVKIINITFCPPATTNLVPLPQIALLMVFLHNHQKNLQS